MPNRTLRCDFIGGSDVRLIMASPARAVGKQAKRAEAGREDLRLGATTESPNRRWYEAVTGRMPICWHVVAVCYATVVILLGWLPWNALLILLLFCNSKRLRFDAFDTMPSDRLGSSQ